MTLLMRCRAIAGFLVLLAPTAVFAQVDPEEIRADEAPASSAPPIDATDAPASSVVAEEAELRAQIGRMAVRRGELETARTELERAQQLDPGADRLLELAAALEALREDAELMRAYRVYLRRAPDGERAEEIRARLAILTERGEGDAAVEAVCEPARPIVSEPPQSERTVLEEPWFYVVIGLLVISAIAGIAAATEAGASQVPPLPGDDGVVVYTLVAW
jgi:tetratricopeptide (TPR) repeat protein